MKVDTSIRPLAVPGDWQWSQAVDHWWCGVCGIWGRCDDNDRCDRIALLHGSIPCPSQGRPGLPRPALLLGHRFPGMKACGQLLSTKVRGRLTPFTPAAVAYDQRGRPCGQRGTPCGLRGVPVEIGGKYSFRGHFRPLPNTE
jgi:hypothetical protein